MTTAELICRVAKSQTNLIKSGLGRKLLLMCDLRKSEMKEPARQVTGSAGWKAPPPGQLKINSDGSFIQETMQGSWGFIVRDHEGDGVLAGAGRLGSIPDAMTAEAAAYA